MGTTKPFQVPVSSARRVLLKKGAAGLLREGSLKERPTAGRWPPMLLFPPPAVNLNLATRGTSPSPLVLSLSKD